MTVWLVRIWTHKNADEKAHTLSRRSKNVKKRTKNGYCVNSPLERLVRYVPTLFMNTLRKIQETTVF